MEELPESADSLIKTPPFQHRFFMKTLECLKYMLDRELMCDLTFRCQGQEIKAHKLVVAAHSSKLYNTLADDPFIDYLDVPDISPVALKHIVSFFYTNNLGVTNENVFDLLFAAKEFDLHEIFKQCSDFLARNISHRNVLQLTNVAVNFENSFLQECCLDYFSTNTIQLITADGFFELQQQSLKLLMTAKKVTSCDEIDLFWACKRWARTSCQWKGIPVANGEDILNELGDIIDHIQFHSFKAEEAATTIMDQAMLPLSIEKDIMKYMFLPQQIKATTMSFMLKTTPDGLQLFKAPRDKRIYHHPFRSAKNKEIGLEITYTCNSCACIIETFSWREWVKCYRCPLSSFCLKCALNGAHFHHQSALKVFMKDDADLLCNLCGKTVEAVPGNCGLCSMTARIMDSDTKEQFTVTEHTRFSPPFGTDTMIKGGLCYNITTRHQCITAMKQYEEYSVEELRNRFYAANFMLSSVFDSSCLLHSGSHNNDSRP